jgi:crotonobetainyl-CoA:carnitine CoA-transferase CaiB-like acyl-CoA transferase
VVAQAGRKAAYVEAGVDWEKIYYRILIMTSSDSNPVEPSGPAPLAGLRVVDAATLFAGPVVATLLGDFGADVIKIEHPRGDALRGLGWEKDGVSLWWTVVSRNKRCVTLNFSQPEGQDILRRLLTDADVFIENFRPGTLERWNLSPADLLEINPRLVILRMTGFGQTGPYRQRPGYGTLAEAISGYAYINGSADGPPTLPPFALGDGIAALAGTAATMFALWWRDTQGGGRGQVVDLAIYEPLFWLLGPQAAVFDQLGIVQERSGNSAPFTAPRNLYKSADDKWLALSASSQSVAERVMRIVGRPDLIDEAWFADHHGRLEHADELDEVIQQWVGARPAAEVLATFEEFSAAIAPAYSIAEIFADAHYRARETLTAVDHPLLGPVTMQNVIARLSATPGQIRHAGAEMGEHNADVLGDELGVSDAELARLEELGVIKSPARAK